MSSLHVDVAGPDDAESVMLLHGGNVGGWMWAPVRAQVGAGVRELVAQLDGSPVPILGLAGSRESPVVTHALAEFARADHAVLRLARGQHHVWNLEVPQLFAQVVLDWVRHGTPHDNLVPVPRSVTRHARRIARRARAAREGQSR